MTDIKLIKAPFKSIRIFLLSIPFVAIGVWMMKSNEVFTLDWIMGLLCSGFFSLGLFVGLFHFLDKRPQIIINEIGIWDRTTKQDLIKWEFIKKAYPISIYRQRFISLVIDENIDFKTKQYKWATKLSKGIGAQKLNIQVSQIMIDESRFTDFINTMIKVNKADRAKVINKYFK
jgi:hypothetical protein